jgi:PiT family inorganic phosphate transporter
MADSVTFVLAILFVALAFDFINGFHDAANSIATIVSTRVLSPSAAVVWAAFWNFVAAFVFGTAIAKTIGKGMIDLSVVDSTVILGGLMGAIIWDLVTWYLGLPTSSSHALVGGYGGAAIAKAGFHAIIASGWVKTLVFIVVAPMMGLAIALLLTVALSWALRRSLPRRVDKVFRALQLVSAALYSLGHGTNDAQKTMGIIVALLVSSQALFATFPIQAFHITSAEHIPTWVILSAHAAIGLGTMAGGWRIVKTMGQRITKLTPFGGFCAEASGAITLFIASHFGIPVSTTHTITGAISGVGAAQRFSAVRWGVAQRIVLAWILTIPASAGIGMASYYLARSLIYAFSRV